MPNRIGVQGRRLYSCDDFSKSPQFRMSHFREMEESWTDSMNLRSWYDRGRREARRCCAGRVGGTRRSTPAGTVMVAPLRWLLSQLRQPACRIQAHGSVQMGKSVCESGARVERLQISPALTACSRTAVRLVRTKAGDAHVSDRPNRTSSSVTERMWVERSELSVRILPLSTRRNWLYGVPVLGRDYANAAVSL